MSGWQAGTQVGPYSLEAKLGEGGASEVWKAAAGDGSWVALKLYRGPMRDTVIGEGSLLQSLQHPNIARVLDWQPDAQPPYIALELVEAGDLRDYLSSRGMPLHDVLRVARQIAEALRYAHGLRAVHGDLKPANILLRTDGSIVLADFGLGSQTPEDGLELSLDDVSVAGSVEYLSPERREGKPPHLKDDLFAFGVVLHEMLTGAKPLGLRPPSHYRPDVPAALDRLVIELLDEREERPDAEAVAERLLNLRPAPARWMLVVGGLGIVGALVFFQRFLPGRLRLFVPLAVIAGLVGYFWWYNRRR